jgi:hypothetical protein
VGSGKNVLEGKSILVAEDEYFLARDLADELERCGAVVVGPVSTVADARKLTETAEVSGAILDVRLGDGLAFGLADEFANRRIPFIFATGFAKAVIPERHRDKGFFEKPFDPAAVVDGLSSSATQSGLVQFRDYNPREMGLWTQRISDAEGALREEVLRAVRNGGVTASDALRLRGMKAAIAAMRAQPGNLGLTVQPWSTRNGLLSGLAEEDFAALAPSLEPCDVRVGTGVATGEADPYVYFPETAILGVFSDQRINVDLGPIGWDGAAGLPALFGSSPFRFVVSEGGTCLRIRADILGEALHRSRSLRMRLMAYEVRRQAEIAEIARANALCTVEQRLARYLLAYRQRSLNDDLRLTHGMLSTMLGVRRPGVTEALHLLEGRGAIRNTRRLVTIRDGAILRQVSGIAYR